MADPGFPNGGRQGLSAADQRSSAVGARIEAPKAPWGLVWGGGVPLPTGEGSGEGTVHPFQKFFDFSSEK